MAVVVSLFVAMVVNKGSSATQKTLFQRFDVPFEGYVVSIILCVFLVLYGFVTALRDDFKVGELSIHEEGVSLSKGKKLEKFDYQQIDILQLEMCYKNTVTDEGGQHWKISFTVDGSHRQLDIVVPENEIDQLITWRDSHSKNG